MMTKFLTSFLLYTCLCGCSPMKVYSDYDREISVSSYKTFGWPSPGLIELRNNPLYYNELNDKRIKREVALRLKDLGYKYVETSSDVVIHYHIIMENRSVVNTNPLGYNYGPYWLGRNVNILEYREGTLILDLMDRKTNNLVWRGWAVDFLNEDQPEKMEEQLTKAIKRILEKIRYPKFP